MPKPFHSRTITQIKNFKSFKVKNTLRKGFVFKGPSFWTEIGKRKQGRRKQVYLAVTETRLLYFQSDSASDMKQYTDTSRIKLTSVTRTEINDAETTASADEFGFSVTTASRTLFFWTDTAEARDRWLGTIRKGMERAAGKAALSERASSFKEHIAEHAPPEVQEMSHV